MKAELAHRLKTKEEAKAFLESCKDAIFTIEDITKRPIKKSPAAPFTTSTLQQEAARKLGYTVAQTMMLAQKLYEAGLITYMRTDSVNLSKYATEGSKQAIINMMGEQYVHPRHFTTKTKGAQEAHEAIRPTYMENSTVEAPSQEKRLYDLIWKRTIASQMAEAELEKTTATIGISTNDDVFTATGEVITFDGFLRVYKESYDDENEQEDESHLLPPLKKGQVLEHNDIVATERFTQRPPRYTEASLVRKLEELGIGRPSTYAPTISTIQQREYVEKGDKAGEERSFNILTLKGQNISDAIHTEIVGAEKSKLLPTDIGTVVNDFLNEYFSNILDYNFTANIEKEFDEVADGEKQWTAIMKHFYKGFHPSVESTLATKTEHKVGERILGEEPGTGKVVSVKIGRFGPYVRHDGKYISLPKTLDPMAITLEEAIELITEKRATEAKRHIKQFAEEPELEILNGRYGPYISYKGSNYKIPKDVVPADLNLKTCLEIIKLQSEKATSTPKKGRTAKKK